MNHWISLLVLCLDLNPDYQEMFIMEAKKIISHHLRPIRESFSC